jgi:hypothetical protein
MPGGRPDDLDVGGAKGLLTRGHPRGRWPLDALEVGLERMHPGHGEQRRRVELGRNQRTRRQTHMTALREELEEGASDLVGGHREGV